MKLSFCFSAFTDTVAARLAAAAGALLGPNFDIIGAITDQWL